MDVAVAPAATAVAPAVLSMQCLRLVRVHCDGFGEGALPR